jgi:hypothetical protein
MVIRVALWLESTEFKYVADSRPSEHGVNKTVKMVYNVGPTMCSVVVDFILFCFHRFTPEAGFLGWPRAHPCSVS